MIFKNRYFHDYFSPFHSFCIICGIFSPILNDAVKHIFCKIFNFLLYIKNSNVDFFLIVSIFHYYLILYQMIMRKDSVGALLFKIFYIFCRNSQKIMPLFWKRMPTFCSIVLKFINNLFRCVFHMVRKTIW